MKETRRYMKTKERKGKTNLFQKDAYAITVLLSFVILLVFRIPLGYIIGDNGNAYFSAANEVYFVIAGAFSYGLTEAVSALVRYRIRREQYRSAHRVLKGALLFGGALGLLMVFLFGALGNLLATGLFHSTLSGLSLRLMSPAILFLILTGVFKGYFQGNGSRVPSLHSLMISTILYVTGGLLGASILHGYGEKVSALLQNEDYACAYGAMGATIGILAASIFCFLHMLALYFIYESRTKRAPGRENIKNQDSQLHIFHMLAGTGAQYAFIWLISSSLPFTGQILLYRLNGEIEGLTAQWGAYYGKYMVVIGMICLVMGLIWLAPVRRITALYEREDHRIARERVGLLVHQCAAVTIPAAIFLAVFAENILDLFWNGNHQQTAGWLQLGSVLVALFAFDMIFLELIRRNKSTSLILISGVVAYVIQLIVTIVLLVNTGLGIMALVIGNIVFMAVLAVAGFFMVCRFLQYRQEWLRCFAITIITAAVAGVIAMLLNKVFAPMLGNLLSMVICLPVAVLSYILLLVVARGFREEEMENLPGGRCLSFLSGWFRFL